MATVQQLIALALAATGRRVLGRLVHEELLRRGGVGFAPGLSLALWRLGLPHALPAFDTFVLGYEHQVPVLQLAPLLHQLPEVTAHVGVPGPGSDKTGLLSQKWNTQKKLVT